MIKKNKIKPVKSQDIYKLEKKRINYKTGFF